MNTKSDTTRGTAGTQAGSYRMMPIATRVRTCVYDWVVDEARGRRVTVSSFAREIFERAFEERAGNCKKTASGSQTPGGVTRSGTDSTDIRVVCRKDAEGPDGIRGVDGGFDCGDADSESVPVRRHNLHDGRNGVSVRHRRAQDARNGSGEDTQEADSCFFLVTKRTRRASRL